MQIKLPIVESRFMVYLQVAGRKIYKYDSIENIREQEFKRISAFRPLPELSILSIPTLDVSEKERVELGSVGSLEESQTELVETLNDDTSVGVSGIRGNLEENEPFKRSLTSEEVSDDKLYSDVSSNVINDKITGLYEELEEDKVTERPLEVEELEFGVEEENEDSLGVSTFEDDLDLEEVGVVEEKVEVVASDLPQWQVFLNSVEPCTLKLDLRNIYFGYLGVIEPVVERKVDVAKAEEFVDKQPIGYEDLVVAEQPKQEVTQVMDRHARRGGEDIVAYARRLVRVSEVEVLKYFSPRELEVALERGNLLRKRGVIIFAHA